MNAISVLRKGIQDGDWGKICNAFEGLTGEKLEPLITSNPTISSVLTKLKGEVNEIVSTANYLHDLFHGNDDITYPYGGNTPIVELPDEQSKPLKTASPRQKEDLNKFVVNNGNPKGRQAVTEKVPVGQTGPNQFVDTGCVAAELISESKAMSQKVPPKEPRPPYTPISLTCCKCNHTYDDMHPNLKPISVDNGDSPMQWVCDRCIGKR